MKPRVLLVGRNRYRLPLDEGLRRKFDALERVLALRVVGSAFEAGEEGDAVFRLVSPREPRALDGALFFAGLPRVVAEEIRAFGPDAVLVQGAHEAAAVLAGRALARSRVPVCVEIHGDWRAPTRLYGSPLRRTLNPVADAAAARALRLAEGVRTVSAYTTALVGELGIAPVAEFPAYMDFAAFAGPPVPLPARPRALFVGALEAYKNVDGLAAAWRAVAARVPDASLHVVGRGRRADVVEALVHDLPDRVDWSPELPASGVARALDEASLLVLPSRSEGMGRVLVEALCRGRPIVASRVGGILDVVDEEVTGVLVEPEPGPLADALVRVLGDRAELERLAAAARPAAEPWLAGPDEFAARTLALVEELSRRAGLRTPAA